jgi:glucose-6-phosphate 1-dehydrogenase
MMKADSQQLAPRVQPREPGASDSFVFSGATGDLAYKQIFPAFAADESDGLGSETT